MYTMSYKGWFIHVRLNGNTETVKVQTPSRVVFPVKSVQAAKNIITRSVRAAQA